MLQSVPMFVVQLSVDSQKSFLGPPIAGCKQVSRYDSISPAIIFSQSDAKKLEKLAQSENPLLPSRFIRIVPICISEGKQTD
jgi:hypothetical protein